MNTPLEGSISNLQGLTPLHLEIILWYNSRADDMENLHASAVHEYLHWLISQDIITGEDSIPTRSYKLTERGRVFLDAILSLPFPVQKWEMQWPR